ncbi:MAG: transglycosylase SLT domain-containing protein [Betaproteobacteria bacterium]|nr:transglycosylase SLT domain-containing protein [Betaproteobacteria bacterium]MDE2056562.1 transglycosylase SLT domain-containing protein [Betaproteobacteria bacterium]
MVKSPLVHVGLCTGLLLWLSIAQAANEPIPVNEEGGALISVPDAIASVKKEKSTPTTTDTININSENIDNPSTVIAQPLNIDTTSDDLWDRIRAGFAMPELNDAKRIQRQIDWYAARPDYVERTVDRSRKYLFFIVEEVQRRKMPTEIALLPIVESAFNPHALSISQASGIWQFIPATGRHYGMEQSWWYDGRRDVVAATNSALDYIQRLHDEFGSWELALAGYNCGEGKVRREIAYNRARNLPTDYLSLNLPDETRNYVPKLLAAKAIVLDPKRYGLTLDSIPNEPYFAVVTTKKRIDTKLAAQFAGMSLSDFIMLNPAFNHSIITLNFNHEQNILVPAAMADSFVAKLEDPQVKLQTWKTEHLKRGESLEQVANRFGISPEELKQVNGIANNKKIAGGGTVLVPDDSGADDQSSEDNGKPEGAIPSPSMNKKPVKVKIQKHDSLESLAQKYNTTAAQLAQWNHLKVNSKLKPGYWLIVELSTGSTSTTTKHYAQSSSRHSLPSKASHNHSHTHKHHHHRQNTKASNP